MQSSGDRLRLLVARSDWMAKVIQTECWRRKRHPNDLWTHKYHMTAIKELEPSWHFWEGGGGVQRSILAGLAVCVFPAEGSYIWNLVLNFISRPPWPPQWRTVLIILKTKCTIRKNIYMLVRLKSGVNNSLDSKYFCSVFPTMSLWIKKNSFFMTRRCLAWTLLLASFDIKTSSLGHLCHLQVEKQNAAYDTTG